MAVKLYHAKYTVHAVLALDDELIDDEREELNDTVMGYFNEVVDTLVEPADNRLVDWELEQIENFEHFEEKDLTEDLSEEFFRDDYIPYGEYGEELELSADSTVSEVLELILKLEREKPVILDEEITINGITYIRKCDVREEL